MGNIIGKGSLSQTPSVANGLRIQTSVQGKCIPVVYGLNRVAGNLIWYGDFSSQGGGGKKGGQGNYNVSIMFAICEGPVLGIPAYWEDGTLETEFAPLGVGVLLGTYPQSPWSYLTSAHPTQALSYPGIALFVGANLVTDGPALVNFNYLVGGIFCSGIAGVTTLLEAEAAYNAQGLTYPFTAGAGGGVLAADIIYDIVTNAKYGLGLSSSILDLADFRTYCLAMNMLLSPVFDSQKSACDQLKILTDVMNAEVVWHDGSVFRVIPYTEEPMSSPNGSWSPDVTPKYYLSDDDYICDDKDDPIKVTRSTPADAYNSGQLEYIDSSNEFNPATIQLEDESHVDQYGRHDMGVKDFHCITDMATAQQALLLLLRRACYIRNTYEFDLSWKYCRIEPMDVIALTDSRLGLNQTLVRVVEVKENSDGQLTVTAEDLLVGISEQVTPPFCLEKICTSATLTGDNGQLSEAVFLNGKIYWADNVGGAAHGKIFDGTTLALLSDVTYASSAVGVWSAGGGYGNQMTWYPELQRFLITGMRGSHQYAYELDINMAITKKTFCGTCQIYSGAPWGPLSSNVFGSSPPNPNWWAAVDTDADYSLNNTCIYNGVVTSGMNMSPDDGNAYVVYSGGNYYWINNGSALSTACAICSRIDGSVIACVTGLGTVSYPVIYGGNLYVTSTLSKAVLRLDMNTLATVQAWSGTGGGHLMWAPMICSGKYAYFCDSNYTAYKFDLDSFTVSLTFDATSYADQLGACSMAADGRLYVGAASSFFVLDATTMTLICRYTVQGSLNPTLQDGSLYFYVFNGSGYPIIKYLPGGTVYGYTVNMTVPPGNVNPPAIFMAPGILTKTGHEIWAAVAGSDPNWGGCDIYGSTDNASYGYLGTVWGRSTYGSLAAVLPVGSDPDTVNTCSVNLGLGAGTLLSVTQADADQLLTLCLVDNELISFETATLTGAYQYNLTYLRRSVYNSAIAAHAFGARFVRLDNKILRYALLQCFPFQDAAVGQTVYFKFVSFNLYGFAKQTLDQVTAYPFIIGTSLSYPSNVTGFAASEVSSLVVFTWSAVTDPNLAGYEIRRNASGVTPWAGATVVVTNQGGNHFTGAVPAGSYTFLICAKDTSGNYSQTPGRVDLVVT